MKLLKGFYTVFAVFFFYCFDSTAQETIDSCRRLNHGEIAKTFPFNVYHRIRIVSFKPDLSSGIANYRMPRKGNNVDTTSFFETRTLTRAASEELIDILINYGQTGSSAIALCFDPRNAILFFDEKKNIIASITLCFECLQQVSFPEKLTLMEFCNGKYEMIRRFFLRNEVEFGTKIQH